MEYLALAVLVLATASAQPATRGVFERCTWDKTSSSSNLYNVTCKAGDLSQASGVDIRSGLTPQLPIYKLDVDMNGDPQFGLQITPHFLNEELNQLKILIVRQDDNLDFGRSPSSTKHDLESLEIHNSGSRRLRENLLKGFDQLTSINFVGLSSDDIVEEALTNMKSLKYLRFHDCDLGEFEESAISRNPSLEEVRFINNTINEFSKNSIMDVEPEDPRRCKYEDERELPVWEFLGNTIGKVDKEAIQINLARKLVFSKNNITERMKTKALSVNIGSNICPNGEAQISNNAIADIDEEGFSIKNKAGENVRFEFSGNVISESRSPFLPQSFDFPKQTIKVEHNVFPCDCLDSGHSWFMKDLTTTSNKALQFFYRELWKTGLCFEENSRPVSFHDSTVLKDCNYTPIPYDVVPNDQDKTMKPATPTKDNRRSTTEAPPSAASNLKSVYSLITMIMVVKYVI